jgi:hypothetical protein
MRKIIFTVITLLLTLQLVSAMNLNIQPQSEDTAYILGSGMPIIYDLKITNNGNGDNFAFYDFFGSDISPKGTVNIGGAETKDISVAITPRSDLRQEGRIKFDLFIKGTNNDQIAYPLMVNVVKLENAFEVGAEEFQPDSNKVSVYIKNTIDFNFNNIQATFKSPFFNFEKTFTIGPYQKESFEVTLNKEDFRDLMAGFYTLNVDVTAGSQKATTEGTMKFSEKDIVTSSQDEYGLIINTQKITKTNEGNVVSKTSNVIRKTLLSRLFTTFSPEPTSVDKKGLSVYYTWDAELKPGESLNIVVRTNWLLPLLAVLLVIAIVILTKQFSRTNLSLKKKVTFVNAKGGEFALKVSTIVTARKFVERVNVIDRLPMLVKLHEKFGGEMPAKVDEKARKIEWHFDKLQPGESRIISYIIYSKVGVLGKFALPTARAVYEKDGTVHESESNHAFFLADQLKNVED